jgi:propionyl-CoA carboxylase alpha chain
MNTRLQVEHPVTERVTGLDLVELMIRVAAGEKLKLTQADIALKGWSIEARVYAEDPMRGFLPSVGRLVRYAEPRHDAHVRVDSGVVEGDEISIYYDPMIAKLVVTDKTREAAIGQLRRALDAFHVRGVRHNIGFLAALAGHPRFAEGRLSTNFIAEEYPDGFAGATLTPVEARRLIWAAASVHRRRVERAAEIDGKLPGYTRFPPDHWTISIDGHAEEVTVVSVDGGFEVTGGGATTFVETDWDLGESLFRGSVDGVPFVVQVDRDGIGYRLYHAGREVGALVLTPLGARLHALMPEKVPADMSSFLLSPMPGLLVSLAVAVGQEVKAGEELAVVEAMKMENVLRAERDGVVKLLHAAAGDSLAVDQAIVEFE